MKFIHLSDLHLGKRLYEMSLIDDQKYILDEIVKIIDSQNVDFVIIAGDVYDKTVPPAEAVSLFDEFLTCLVRRNLKVFIISGNHDSAERLAFGSDIMSDSGVYFSQLFDGRVRVRSLSDEFGEVCVYMLPFIKPPQVKRFFPDAEISDFNTAVKTVLENTETDESNRNILIAHQFVTGAECCESESYVGGLDNVDASDFDKFDYVALGHLHGPQHIGRPEVRYCGTPLKYSFSEMNHKKSVTVVELGQKGEVRIDEIPLTPLHDMREIRGSYEELTLLENYKGTATDDYIRAVLTDEEEIPEGIYKLRTVYKNILELRYDNKRSRANSQVLLNASEQEKTPMENFVDLYKQQNGSEPDEEQKKYLDSLFEKIWEGEA